MIEFKFPDLGEGLVEGEVVKWHKREGDFVKEGEDLVDVMTEKATVTLPSPATGRIVKILAKEGEVVKVGQVLCIIEEAAPGAPVEAKAEARPEVRAMPAARRLAKELGLDLSKVAGTGPGGVITVEDVRRAAEAAKRETGAAEAKPAAPAPPAEERPAQPLREERIPVRGVRRAVAEKMKKSKSQIPHAYHVDEVDVTELVKLREKLKAYAGDVRLTYTPFFVKAAVAALKKYPLLNASFDEERGEIVVKKYFNIGVAVDTENGLVVVVVKDADSKSILEVARELQEKSARAREGKLSLDDVRDSTFTITNIGAIGGLWGLAVVNYPETAILATGRIVKRPRVYEGQVVPRDVMYVAVSFDHRVVDGGYVARFTNAFKELLESPDLLVLNL